MIPLEGLLIWLSRVLPENVFLRNQMNVWIMNGTHILRKA